MGHHAPLPPLDGRLRGPTDGGAADSPRLSDDEAMGLALEEAAKAAVHGDVPVGAVALVDGRVIAARHNEREQRGDPTAHAELLALSDGPSPSVSGACRRSPWW